MTPFNELAASREYWLTKIQNELYDCVEQYLKRNRLTRTQFAEQLGVTKGYISQILNGDFDHKLSKLIDLSLAVGVVPNMHLQELETYVTDYLSGYDGSIAADKVSINITVTNPLRQYDLAYDAGQNTTGLFVDNETYITYERALHAA
jgi:transcriptional regulator with XRE-family HTH domain